MRNRELTKADWLRVEKAEPHLIPLHSSFHPLRIIYQSLTTMFHPVVLVLFFYGSQFWHEHIVERTCVTAHPPSISRQMVWSCSLTYCYVEWVIERTWVHGTWNMDLCELGDMKKLRTGYFFYTLQNLGTRLYHATKLSRAWLAWIWVTLSKLFLEFW